jgi:hypothetical protein
MLRWLPFRVHHRSWHMSCLVGLRVMPKIPETLAPRFCVVSAGLTALASSSAALHHTAPPAILLAVAATFAVAAGVCSIPLRAFPAYGLLMAGLVVAVAAAYLLAPDLSRDVGIVLAAVGAVALVAAAWPPQPGPSSPVDRASLAPPSSSGP